MHDPRKPLSRGTGQARPDPSTCLFDEASIAAAHGTIKAHVDRLAVLLPEALGNLPEPARLAAVLQAAETATALAQSAARLAGDCRYLGGFLMGAGVRLQ